MMRGRNPMLGLSTSARREIKKILAEDPDHDECPEYELCEHDGAPDLDDQINAKQLIAIGLVKLSPRQERVVRLRYGFGGVGCHTYHEIGLELGLNTERVRQIEQAAHRTIVSHWKRNKLWSAQDEKRWYANRFGTPVNAAANGQGVTKRKTLNRQGVWRAQSRTGCRETCGFESPTKLDAGVSASLLAARPATHRARLSSLLSRLWNWAPSERLAQRSIFPREFFNDRPY